MSALTDGPHLTIDGDLVTAGCVRCRLGIGRESVCLNCGAERTG